MENKICIRNFPEGRVLALVTFHDDLGKDIIGEIIDNLIKEDMLSTIEDLIHEIESNHPNIVIENLSTYPNLSF